MREVSRFLVLGERDTISVATGGDLFAGEWRIPVPERPVLNSFLTMCPKTVGKMLRCGPSEGQGRKCW